MTEQYRAVREHLMDRWWDTAEVLCKQLEPGRLDRLLQCDCEAEHCDCGLTAEQRGLIDQLNATEREIKALGGWIAR